MFGAKRGKQLIDDCRHELNALEMMISQGLIARDDLLNPDTEGGRIASGIYARYGQQVVQTAMQRNLRGY